MSVPKCDDCGKTATHHQCRACALSDLDKIGDQIADLMARLRAVRAMTVSFRKDRYEPWVEMEAATNLRDKDWKKVVPVRPVRAVRKSRRGGKR